MSFFVYYLLSLLFPSFCFSFEKQFSANVKRYTLSSGFHSILVYNVTIQKVNNGTAILITEELPKDLYLDPFEILDEINESKVKIQVPFKYINTEAPEYLAQPFGIELCSTSENNFHQIFLPIHCRYQGPHFCKKFKEHVSIEMNIPTLKFAYHDHKMEQCSTPHSWTPVETLQVSNQDTFFVPVGCKEDFNITISLTFITLGLTAISLLAFINKLHI